MKSIEVVAAIIQNDNDEIFCARRKNDGELALKWEFPGGKIEEQETPKEALKREIKEELTADIEVQDYLMTVKHQYNTFHLTMHAYYAKITNGTLQLKEHTSWKWLPKNRLHELDWAAADIPLIEALTHK